MVKKIFEYEICTFTENTFDFSKENILEELNLVLESCKNKDIEFIKTALLEIAKNNNIFSNVFNFHKSRE